MFDVFKIIDFFKKNFSKKHLLIGFFIIILFLFTRLINLDKFPIFCDEGIYIRWAKVAWKDASWRFISLTDGKQPLQTWGTIPFLKLFPENALLAGRLFGVIGGLISLIGVFSLSFYLFGKKTAFITSFLYLITPYFLFYERMALVDSWVNAGSVWILFLLIYLVKERKLSASLILGLTTGIFLLAKSTVRIFLLLGVLAPILIYEKKLKHFLKNSFNYFILFGFGSFLALIIYNIQRLSPFFHYVSQKNLTFIMSFSEFLKTPFQYFWHNLKYAPLYIFWEMGFVLGVLGVFGLIKLIKKQFNLGLFFFFWFIIPFLAIIFFTKVLTPRYLIFFASFFLILAGYFISNSKIKKTLIFLFLISTIYFNYTIIFDYKNIPFPPVDRGQYIEGWPAGWGVKETIDYVREKSKQKPSIIIAEGNFGISHDVLDVFIKSNDKITIKAYWPLKEENIFKNLSLLKDNNVYIFFSDTNKFPEHWPIKLIKKIDKPGNKHSFYFYQLLNND